MNSQVLTRYARITSAHFVLQFSKISGPKVFDRAEISVRFLRECSRICKDKGARDMIYRQSSNPAVTMQELSSVHHSSIYEH